MPRGHPWPDQIRQAVITASQLGVGPTITEAITGVSKRSIQRFTSQPERSTGHHRETRYDKILNSEHHHVS